MALCDFNVFCCAPRKNLSELDDIQRYFSRKLTNPTFPKLSEMRGTSRQEDLRETDNTKLLLKSNQLVGEVNNIIKGEMLQIFSDLVIHCVKFN